MPRQGAPASPHTNWALTQQISAADFDAVVWRIINTNEVDLFIALLGLLPTSCTYYYWTEKKKNT